MKTLPIVLLTFAPLVQVAAQSADSLTSQPLGSQTPSDTVRKRFQPFLSTYTVKQNSAIISYENVSFVSTGLVQSTTQKTILELESTECGALKIHDMAALQRLWSRDFTQDKQPNQVVDQSDPLPRYAYLARMIEVFTEVDPNMVCTSGYEQFQELKSNGTVNALVKRKFFHTWIQKNGLWKLSTKKHN